MIVALSLQPEQSLPKTERMKTRPPVRTYVCKKYNSYTTSLVVVVIVESELESVLGLDRLLVRLEPRQLVVAVLGGQRVSRQHRLSKR